MDYTLPRRIRRHDREEEVESKRRKRREFPDDVMIEVLLRLPVRSLVRFYCVCKSWRDLILSPTFISMYNNTSSIRNGKVSLYRKGFAHRVDIVGCSNGLVCLSLSEKQDLFMVWNPATTLYRHILWVPSDYYVFSDELGLFSSGFFSDPIANNFFKLTRIAFFTPFRVSNGLQVDVFSSTDNAWIIGKRIVVPEHPTCKQCCAKSDVICVGRCMYWLIANFNSDCDCSKLSDNKYILCFDMVDELFRRIELPSCRGDFRYSTLVAYEESIAMFVRRMSGFSHQGCAFDLWVMNDSSGTNPPTWSKQLTVKPRADATFADGFICKEGGTRWVILRTSSRDICLINPETGETTEFSGRDLGKLFLYSESLVPIS